MIDDGNDLEKDLATGHYSYRTLGFKHIDKSSDPRKTAQLLREDKKRIYGTYAMSKEMIA